MTEPHSDDKHTEPGLSLTSKVSLALSSVLLALSAAVLLPHTADIAKDLDRKLSDWTDSSPQCTTQQTWTRYVDDPGAVRIWVKETCKPYASDFANNLSEKWSELTGGSPKCTTQQTETRYSDEPGVVRTWVRETCKL